MYLFIVSARHSTPHLIVQIIIITICIYHMLILFKLNLHLQPWAIVRASW